MVPSAGGHDHHRQPELRGDASHERLRPVSSRHPDHVVLRRGLADDRHPVLPRLEHDRFDPSRPAFVDETEALGLAPSRLQVHEQHPVRRGRHGFARRLRLLKRPRRRPDRVPGEPDRDDQRDDPQGEREGVEIVVADLEEEHRDHRRRRRSAATTRCDPERVTATHPANRTTANNASCARTRGRSPTTVTMVTTTTPKTSTRASAAATLRRLIWPPISEHGRSCRRSPSSQRYDCFFIHRIANTPHAGGR